MVVDTLDNLEKYVSLNPLFADVVKFIKDNDLSKLEDGKHFIKESNLFVNITNSWYRDCLKAKKCEIAVIVLKIREKYAILIQA